MCQGNVVRSRCIYLRGSDFYVSLTSSENQLIQKDIFINQIIFLHDTKFVISVRM